MSKKIATWEGLHYGTAGGSRKSKPQAPGAGGGRKADAGAGAKGNGEGGPKAQKIHAPVSVALLTERDKCAIRLRGAAYLAYDFGAPGAKPSRAGTEMLKQAAKAYALARRAWEVA